MTDLKPHIERAISLFGSQAKLAAAMACSQQQIAYLLKARRVSAEMAVSLHDVTAGDVSKHVLRPDLFGPQAPTPAEDAA